MQKIISAIKYLFYFILPAASVVLCRLFAIAGGEKNEEIVLGVFIGIALDFLYSLCLWLGSKNKVTKRINKTVFIVFACISALILAAFLIATLFGN